MLDIGMQESSLQAKRRDLVAKIAEGRVVIARLVERHAAMGRKIDEANAAMKDLERQLEAMNTVIQIFDREGLVLAPDQTAPGRLFPSGAESATAEFRPYVPPAPEPFKPLSFAKCLARGGHRYVTSRSTPGLMTCTRCRHRKAS